MIIDLSTIEHVPRHFDLIFKPEWWQGNEEDSRILGLDGPLECHIDIFKAGVRYILEGSLSASVLATCDRCLDPFRYEIDADFRLSLTTQLPGSDLGDLELTADDIWIQPVEGTEFVLDDIIQEQIYLSLPMKSLCREDCSGLCPICGINLNEEGCECQRGRGHPGFSKLRFLKFNGEH